VDAQAVEAALANSGPALTRPLDSAVAVITGAGSGIGRATALALAKRGCAVVVSDIDAGRASAVSAEIATTGGRASGARCDVANDADVDALYQTTMSDFGQVDIVMSNVGIIVKGLPLEIPMAAWQSIVDVNLLGTVRILGAFLPALLEQGSGHVVTTGSTAGLFPYAFDRLPYAATKAGIVALTESLALYLRPKGVGVSCFCPAGVMTNIVEQVREYGPPTPLQAPQVPVISAEDAGEIVVRGIVENRLLILTDPVAGAMVERHALDREEFLRAQIDYLEGRT
jgi:NAD(P)-dependent dehydrogenase (short-subunit alcohol dehydrogenase family)